MTANSIVFFRVRVKKYFFFEFKFEFGKNDRVQASSSSQPWLAQCLSVRLAVGRPSSILGRDKQKFNETVITQHQRIRGRMENKACAKAVDLEGPKFEIQLINCCF